MLPGTEAQAPVAELSEISLPALEPSDIRPVPATAGLGAAPPRVSELQAVAPVRGVTVPWAPPM